MWISYIMMTIPVLFLRGTEVCAEDICLEDKLFLKHDLLPEASGWYKKYNHCYYMKTNVITAEYVFENVDNTWKLYEYPENEGLDIGHKAENLVYITDKNMSNLLQENFTNFRSTSHRDLYQIYHSQNYPLVNPRFNAKNQEMHQLLNMVEDDYDEVSSETLYGEDFDVPHEPSMGFYESHQTEDVLKIFFTNRCSCTKLEISFNGIPNREFYRSDFNQTLTERCKLSKINDFPNESYNSFENRTIEKQSNLWRAEVYISDICQILYYDTYDDTWIVELQDHCSSYEKGIYYLIWSQDSAPCVEYLPPPHRQTWMYYSRLTVFDYPKVINKISIENCGDFKQSIYENFTVICTQKTEGLS